MAIRATPSHRHPSWPVKRAEPIGVYVEHETCMILNIPQCCAASDAVIIIRFVAESKQSVTERPSVCSWMARRGELSGIGMCVCLCARRVRYCLLCLSDRNAIWRANCYDSKGAKWMFKLNACRMRVHRTVVEGLPMEQLGQIGCCRRNANLQITEEKTSYIFDSIENADVR